MRRTSLALFALVTVAAMAATEGTRPRHKSGEGMQEQGRRHGGHMMEHAHDHMDRMMEHGREQMEHALGDMHHMKHSLSKALDIDLDCVKLSWDQCAAHVTCVKCLAFGRIQMCFNEAQAAKLSPRFFNCSLPEELPAAAVASTAASEAAEMDGARASKGRQQQPTSVLAVSRSYASNDDCEAKKDASTCAHTSGCVWCISGAVPPACYTEDEAKRLPPSVFQCQFPSAAA